MNAQLDQAVGEQNARALLHVFRQSLEGGAHQRCGARHIARRNGQPLAGLEQHRLVIFQLGGADLGPLQIAQDAQRLALLAAHLADHLDQRQLLLVGAVGKVQANHIHAGANQIAEDGLGVGGGAKRGDNFCAALRWATSQSELKFSELAWVLLQKWVLSWGKFEVRCVRRTSLYMRVKPDSPLHSSCVMRRRAMVRESCHRLEETRLRFARSRSLAPGVPEKETPFNSAPSSALNAVI